MAEGPRIAILGAGSIGCFIGGAWLAAGCNVSFVGREGVRAEIADHGLGLSDHEGWRIHLAPSLVQFATDPAVLAEADIIAFCVKTGATEAAAREIKRHARPGATIITFQNGVGSAERLKRLLPGLEIVQAIIAFNVARLGRGHWHKGTSGDLIAARCNVTRALAGRLGDRPGRLILSDDMAGAAWGKLLINLNNAVNALSGRTLLEELSERDYRRVVAAAMLETLELLKAAGIEAAKVGALPPALMPHAIAAPDFLFRNLLLRVQKIDAAARSSMYDDLAAGRATEIDELNGEVVRLARSLGREAPVNAAIVALVRQAEKGGRRDWPAAELRRLVVEGHRDVRGFGY